MKIGLTVLYSNYPSAVLRSSEYASVLILCFHS